MTETLEQIIARWDSGDGKPYKGRLIDMAAYRDDSGNVGCMCAQGQVLHLLGGWSAEKLDNTPQRRADLATAKLLNISVAHAILLRSVNDSVDGAPSIVLTHPEKVIGDQAPILLAFWLHLDRITDEDWSAAGSVAWSAAGLVAGSAAGSAAGLVAGSAAGSAARSAAGSVAWSAARSAARSAAGSAARSAAEYAGAEIQGAKLLRELGKPFYFLPMFGFEDPDAIPALPADYGTPGGAA